MGRVIVHSLENLARVKEMIKLVLGVRPRFSKNKDTHSTSIKGKDHTQTLSNRDIKCFKYLGSWHIASQCLNK